MKLSAFIDEHMPSILADWERHAATMSPAADVMDVVALRDHAEQMLRVMAADIDSPQTEDEQEQKSLGTEDDVSERTAASKHGALRHNSQFSLLQLSSEFRALRASVLHLWLPQSGLQETTVNSVVRFNEAIDQALAESIVTFSRQGDIARDMFVGILSHDLRGPLATMAMVGGLLAEPTSKPERIAEFGAMATRATRQMTAMVNDLLGVTSAKLGGGIPILRGPLDLGTVCEGAIQDASAMHPAAIYTLDKSGDLSGELDGVRLHQLLVNLLGNAAQHGHHGRPVRLRVRGDGSELLISVTNEGVEIPATRIDSLFEPMVQLQDRHAGGAATSLGLGLYVAQEIAKGHGGTIKVSTAPGENTFTVRLPRYHNATPGNEKQAAVPHGWPGRYAMDGEPDS